MTEVVAFVPDLIDRSKIAAVVPGATFVRAASDVAGAVAAGAGDVVVLLDLGRPGAIDAIADAVTGGARVVGFASHVDRETIAGAREAGCEVLARSAFFGRIADLLA